MHPIKAILALPVLAAAMMFNALAARAQMIDFETLPGGAVPTPGMFISNQFTAAFGVSFRMHDGEYPRIAKRDDPSFAAFVDDSNALTNHPATNQNVGNFFLTGQKGLSAPAHTLIVTYAKPTKAASGVILDIDGQEFWDITINMTNGATEEIWLYSPFFANASPNAGDGLATAWAVAHTNADISSIQFLGNNNHGAPMGWALDNFSPYSATPPPSVSLTITKGIPQIGIAGPFGTTNQLQYASSLLARDWRVLTNAVLTNAPLQYYSDAASSNNPARFYRAVRVN